MTIDTNAVALIAALERLVKGMALLASIGSGDRAYYLDHLRKAALDNLDADVRQAEYAQPVIQHLERMLSQIEAGSLRL